MATGLDEGAASRKSLHQMLTRKLQHVLDIRTDTPAMILALQTLAPIHRENTLTSRRALRSTLEAQGLRIHNQLLNAFSQVNQTLESISSDVADLSSSCHTVAERLTAARSATHQLITETERSRDKRRVLEQQQHAADVLLFRFQLTPHEQHTLQAQPTNEDFFQALERVSSIETECKNLLATRFQKIAFEALDALRDTKELAYGHLHAWLLRSLSPMFSLDSPELPPLFQMGIVALRQRPGLLESVLHEAAQLRRACISQRFYHALTRGGRGAAPLETHAHDAPRYLTAILAWLHQTVASECELVVELLQLAPRATSDGGGGGDAGENAEPAAMVSFPVDSEVLKVLDVSLSGVTELFESRVRHILQDHNLVVSFRLAQLLDFYNRTVAALVTPAALLPQLLARWHGTAMESFRSALKQHVDKLLQSPPSFPSDLSAPHMVLETTHKLAELMAIFNQSLVAPEERDAAFRPILDAIISPLLEICARTAEGLTKADRAVFMLNTLTSLQAVLKLFEFAADWALHVETQLRQHLDVLVDQQSSESLKKCGLGEKLGVLHSSAAGLLDGGAGADAKTKTISEVPETSAAAMTRAFSVFYSSLRDLGGLVMPHVESLQHPQLRADARKHVSRLVFHTYSLLYAAVVNPENGYSSPETIAPFTPEHVAQLLDIPD